MDFCNCWLSLTTAGLVSCRYGVNDTGNMDFPSFMSLMKDVMLDVRELLSYLGARPESPSTASSIIHVSDTF